MGTKLTRQNINESEDHFKMSKLTVEILKNLAKQGKVPSVVIEDNEFNSSIAKTNWFLRHDENKIVNFHYNSTILMWARACFRTFLYL